ncbi:MAG: phosphatidate cytidylyltransferase, partial [Treponema sp.]|nr:phosphatidate cytidylyltransferase [Treponema sp.]
MKKIIERLVVFFVGLPLLIALVFFLPYYHHLCLNLVIIIFTILGALEFRNILSHKALVISVPETIVLGAVSPIAWTVVVSFGIRGHIVPGAFILGASWLLVSRIFTTAEKLDSYIS